MASVLKSGYSSGGRALASGARGRAFESHYPDQICLWQSEAWRVLLERNIYHEKINTCI